MDAPALPAPSHTSKMGGHQPDIRGEARRLPVCMGLRHAGYKDGPAPLLGVAGITAIPATILSR